MIDGFCYSTMVLQQGVREHEDHVALYYALRRHADGMFNAKTGRYDGISSVYRMKLVPVFVVDPDKPMGIPDRESEAGRRRAFDATAAATIKAVDTLVPQPVPPGSRELTADDYAFLLTNLLGRDTTSLDVARIHLVNALDRNPRFTPASLMLGQVLYGGIGARKLYSMLVDTAALLELMES